MNLASGRIYRCPGIRFIWRVRQSANDSAGLICIRILILL